MKTKYNFVNNLDIIRRREGYTIKNFTKLIGIGECTWHRWKKGDIPTTENVEKALDVLEELLGVWVSWDVLADPDITEDDIEKKIYGKVI